jgi:hypothetical protein
MCPRTAVYVFSYCYICVLVLLYVSSYCCICVLLLLYMSSPTAIYVSYTLILVYMCPHTGRSQRHLGVSSCVLVLGVPTSYCYICVLLLLYMCLRLAFPTSLIYVSYTLILVYMCPRTRRSQRHCPLLLWASAVLCPRTATHTYSHNSHNAIHLVSAYLIPRTTVYTGVLNVAALYI